MQIENIHLERHHLPTTDETRDQHGDRSQQSPARRLVAIARRPSLSCPSFLSDDCSSFNSSIGPIRFRIGYREYLIGYLSYNRFLSAKYSMITILSLVITSCLLTIAFLTLVLYLCLKCRPSKSARSSLATKTTDDSNGKPLWSTETSASTGPYYQVYEQISSSSSHENTLTRAPLLFCPHYQEKRCTPPLMEQLQMGLSFLTTISVDDEQLRQILLSNEKR